MDMEKRLALGLLAGFEDNATQDEWMGRLSTVLAKQPSLVIDSADVGGERWAAWQQFKGTSQGKDLLVKARYRVQLKDKREAPSWAAWFHDQPHLCAGWFIDASSPVKVVEWKWPLTVAIMNDAGYSETQAALTYEIERGPEWMQAVINRVQQPADEVGAADILIFPRGFAAREALFSAVAPVTADLLLLCDVGGDQVGEVAAAAEELLELTQANAVLISGSDPSNMSFLRAFIKELAHDQPIDVAVRCLRNIDVNHGRAILLSTPLFVKQSRLSIFSQRLSRRFSQMKEEEPVIFGGQAAALPQLTAGKARNILQAKISFDSESNGASMISALASAAPPPPKSQEEPASRSGGPVIKKTRFLIPRLMPQENTRVLPAEALEAGKQYKLAVHIGRKTSDDMAGSESFPEPPVCPSESGVNLAVVFFEKNSKPEAELKTIFLPRAGESSPCEFKFVASASSSIFEGRVSVYHNNRLLQEGVLRSKVINATVQSGAGPEKTTFKILSVPHPLQIGLEGRSVFGGTLRFESGTHLTSVRGLRAARVKLPGLKAAVDSLEAELNKTPWESLGSEWATNDRAAERLSKIAQQGYQIHEALCESPLLKELEKDAEENPKPFLVYAADSNVRAPLELCYAGPEPKTTARICPDAPKAVAAGRCVAGCVGKQNSADHVCPMAFWGLSRVLEWRSQVADSREDPEALKISNEPVSRHRTLKPLRQVLVARSTKVEDTHLEHLQKVLTAKTAAWKEVKSWEEWKTAVETECPTMLVLMPHVDNQMFPPSMEIQAKKKDPPGIAGGDVVSAPPQHPIVLLLGCGAAISMVDFANLPAQFRRKQAAIVVAPIAEVLAEDAPELAAALIETFAEQPRGSRPFGELLLKAKRRLLMEGKLAGILLLAFGDADWLV